MKKIPSLPKSDDEYFESAEKYTSPNMKLPICDTHGKKWLDHVGYVDNHDGTASCKYCSWGFILPGYLRVHNDRVFDLRHG